MVMYCCVPNCSGTSKTYSVYRFPNDQKLTEKWIEAIGRFDFLKYDLQKIRAGYRVCAKHFSDKQTFPQNRNKTNLKKNAISDLYLNRIATLDDRHEAAEAANTILSFIETSNISAGKCSILPADNKQQYVDTVEQDRETSTSECNTSNKTIAFKQFTQQNEKKEIKKESPPTVIVKVNTGIQNNIEELNFSNFNIPIFTKEFLDHNKSRDVELRQLRNSNTNCEQQNVMLQKHIEGMKMAFENLEGGLTLQKKKTDTLQLHFEYFKSILTNRFGDVKLPDIKETTAPQTIDSYLTNLHSMLIENSNHVATLLQNVRDAVDRVEFQG